MIDEKASPEFCMEIIPTEDEIDELGHVSNVAYVRWIQDIAKAHSAAIGLDHATYERIGKVFVVRKHEVEYLAPAFLGERIVLFTHVAGWKGATSERRTRIVRQKNGQELARAVTLWAFVSKTNGRPRRIDRDVIHAFRQPPSAMASGG